jgi:sigma-E factor negative regulatory protein RseB
VISRPLPFIIFALAAASSAAAEPPRQDGVNWLQTMAFAAHQTDYSGIFVYRYGKHVETTRITHIADHDGEHGRLESLDGIRREVIRHNDKTWCFVGDHQVQMSQGQVGQEFPALLPQELALLNENYLVRQAEEERLAGFYTHAVILQPKDNLRFTHKMWADSASGLMLKSEVLDEHGGVIEQYSFTQLSVGGNVDRKWMEATEPPANSRPLDPHHTHALYEEHAHLAQADDPAEPTAVTSGWIVDALPPGFKKIAEVRRRMRGRDAPVIQMVFSDGLAGISVFVEKSDGDWDDKPGLSSRGLIQVYSRQSDGYLVTVVGEVPPRTVIQVGDSVRNGGG